MKIAMWSGPRNLSTAMMYAFGNRPDFAAWDEPFYGAYLAATGIDHPLRDTVLAAHETDPQRVAQAISDHPLDGEKHLYMKHMTFHMCPGFPLDWAEDCVNVHLIRHPARVIASYMAKRENPTLDDIGFRRQVEIFDRFPGPVLDSADIRADPAGMLGKLCDIIGLSWDPRMTSWSAGPRNSTAPGRRTGTVPSTIPPASRQPKASCPRSPARPRNSLPKRCPITRNCPPGPWPDRCPGPACSAR